MIYSCLKHPSENLTPFWVCALFPCKPMVLRETLSVSEHIQSLTSRLPDFPRAVWDGYKLTVSLLGWCDRQVRCTAWNMKQDGGTVDSHVTKHQWGWQDQRPRSVTLTSLQLIGRYRPSQLPDQKMERRVNNLTVAICWGESNAEVFFQPSPILCASHTPRLDYLGYLD